MGELIQISLEDYCTGPDGVRRDLAFPSSFSTSVYDAAVQTVVVVNSVLEAMASDGIYPGIVEKTGLCIASGWRPRIINEHTSNAADNSWHIYGKACDIQDTPDRALVRWALDNEDVLRACGVLGMERPQWTPHWLHIQTVAAHSGTFCYIPSSSKPTLAALPGEVV